jgi:hypothetical protein
VPNPERFGRGESPQVGRGIGGAKIENHIANFLIRHRLRRSIELAPAVDELPAIIAVRPAARNRFVRFVYNRNHVFAYKIDGPSAEAAEGLTVR